MIAASTGEYYTALVMENNNKALIESIIRRRKSAHQELLRRGSRVYKAFLDMESAAYADGKLAAMYKELIAVGISVVIDCESCMQWHIQQALASGASEEQVLEAIEVGIEMGGGPATVSARFALQVLDYHRHGG
jgi:AhpD family alkylhydroperoxidase